MSTKLPNGWITTTLKECASVNMGQSPKGVHVNENAEGMPFYQGKAEFGEAYPTPKKYCTQPTKIAHKDDILLSIRAPVGPTNLCPEESCIGRGLAGIRAEEGISQDYLLKYFKYLEQWLSQQGTGSTFKAISGAFLRDVDVVVAPLNEQIRIANKLDSLLAKVDAAQARLEKIPNLLKRFRQSVLAAATSGELTRGWRDGEEVEWESCKVGEIISHIEAGKNIKCDERPPDDDEYGIIKISAVTWGFYDERESKTLFNRGDFIESRRVQVGDFLISRANTLELLGMPVIVGATSKNLMLSDKVLRLVMPDTEKKWLNIFFRSPLGRKEIESRATGNQQSMRNIGQKALMDIDVPMPLPDEKVEIVRRVESLFALADTVEKQYHEAKKRTDRLTQSLLAKAFRGELVPQDPNDEPAAELLKRVQAERESQAAKKPKRKTSQRKARSTTKAEKHES